ncbi:hypothetical protein GCM10010247_09380 [Streptomyces calvus]|nr:hypothetical protein GCM10010247_09380 [Streptomyces calvus]
MRACPSCGASNDPTDDFCGNCGAYLGWSDSSPAPSTPPQPSTPTPADESTPAAPPEAGEAGAAPADGSPSGDPEKPATGRPDPTSAPPRATPAATRTDRPAPGSAAPGPATPPPTRPPHPTGPDPAAASGTSARPPGPPPAPSARTPAAPTPDPVLPVRPAKPVAPRPVVRPAAAVPDEGAGVPCPACGALNAPGRRFCRRCATALNLAPKAAPLPWWRTVWPLRRRVRAGSGRAVRLLVILAVLAALCVGGVWLLPAGRALVEDTRDKLSKPKPVTPVSVEASAEIPRHPATNTTDGLSNRYWGAPAAGASVTYTFRKPFRLIDLSIINGVSKSPDQYDRQARALQLDMEVTTQDGERHHKELTLADKAGPQTFPTGISDVTSIRLVLRSPVGLSDGRHLALAEVEFFQRG